MPPVRAPRNDAHVDAHTRAYQQPQAQGARLGFWRSLAHALITHLTPPPRARHAPVRRTSRPFELPMDRLVQEDVSLSVLALAIL